MTENNSINTAAQYLNITASLITVLWLVSIFQQFFKWMNSPRFNIGVLPVTKDGITTIGKVSHFDEFSFDSRFLAKKLSDEDGLGALKSDHYSSRNIRREGDGVIKLPVIVQNKGRSEAARYGLVISFSNPAVRITDVQAESLRVESLYTQEDSFANKQTLAGKLPAPELRQIYQHLNLAADYLSLTGSLPSGAFEAVSLKLRVPADCGEFCILFKIDCPDFFRTQRQVYAQHINILK